MLAVSGTMFAAALLGPGSASGQSPPPVPPSPCPDAFVLLPVVVVPASDADKDRNGNFLVCAKLGGNPHAGFIVVDDTLNREPLPVR